MLIQNRLGLPKDCGAVDINLGCFGLRVRAGLGQGADRIEASGARAVSHRGHIQQGISTRADKSVRGVLADGAAATLLTNDASAMGGRLAGPFVYGTDGRGAPNLIVPAGGFAKRTIRMPRCRSTTAGRTHANNVYMDGAEIFAFTLREVPATINRVLSAKGLTVDDVDLFVPHQANAFILAHLQRKLRIPPERFVIDMADCGNTGSSTIAVTALRRGMERGALRAGMRVMLVGFGVGYSWGATLLSGFDMGRFFEQRTELTQRTQRSADAQRKTERDREERRRFVGNQFGFNGLTEVVLPLKSCCPLRQFSGVVEGKLLKLKIHERNS